MRLLLFFSVICGMSRAQFPVIQAGADILMKTAHAKNSIKKSQCSDTNGDRLLVANTVKGLIFERVTDSAGKKIKKQTVILPIKNELHFKINSNPGIAIDKSNGTFKGRIYVCWSDTKNGINNEDVFIAYSDDKGELWTEPILITYRPNHKKQFNPAIHVNSVNGAVYLMYYNSENYLSSKYTDVNLAISTNGGLKFDSYKLNETPVLPNISAFVFEEKNINTFHAEVYPGWFRKNKNNQEELLQAMVNDSTILNYLKEYNSGSPEMARTFAFDNEIKVGFKLKGDAVISAAITKPLEPGFEKTIVKDKRFKAGNNTLLIKSKEMGLKKGSYVLTLYCNQKNYYTWITEE